MQSLKQRSSLLTSTVRRTTARSSAVRTFATGKDLAFGTDARDEMSRGVNRLADAVQVTLGPRGRNVMIDSTYGAPKITKDGVTVAKNVEFKEKFENMGAQLVRSVASKTNDAAGDGTTTATILTRAIYNEGTKLVAAGLNPLELRNGVNEAVTAVIEQLKSTSTTVSNIDRIAEVATISANNDTEIGKLIATAMDKVGTEGVITVQDGNTLHDELEVVEGMNFDRGFISPYFITEPKTQTCEYEKPLILLMEAKVSTMESLVPVLEYAVKGQRPLIVICEDVDGNALPNMVYNKIRGVKVCAIKAPGFGDNRKHNLQDLAVLTGGTVISDMVGLDLETMNPAEHLGTCARITVTKDNTTIVDGAGAKESIEDRCTVIRESIANTKSTYEQEKLQERLAKLSGGVAVLKVGGASEVEVGEKKDRIEDALNATRAAVEEGIVPGGGAALLHASKILDELKKNSPSMDHQQGIEIIEKACRIPSKTIAENASVEGAVIVGKLLEQTDTHFGYDAKVHEFKNMLDAGIVDPTKVVRTALQDAASVASLMNTTECMITDLPAEEGAAGPGAAAMGGMGGMGGMPGMM